MQSTSHHLTTLLLLTFVSLMGATVRAATKGPAFEFANYWVQEDEESVQVAITRTNNADSASSVSVRTADGSAQSERDYLGITNTLTFLAGEKVKRVVVPILNNSLREADRFFRVVLYDPSSGTVVGSPATASIRLVDNDPGIQFTQNRHWVAEQDGHLLLSITRGTDNLSDAFTVSYSTRNGTALAGQDYVATNGILSFSPGVRTQSIDITLLTTSTAKADRQFSVSLSDPTGGFVLGTSTNTQATVTICDLREMLPHRFGGMQILPDGSVSLTLTGGYTPGLGLSNRFQPYFDIFPLEVSTNLIDWTPLAWVIRTNALTNQVTYTHSNSITSSRQYYRTPTTNFVAPQRPPSGPYPVGVIDRTLLDPTRRNRYRISTNGEIPMTIWYPAKRTSGQWPSVGIDAEPITRDPRPGAWGGFVDRAPYWRTYAIQNAPFAEGLSGLPVVLRSHGGQVYRNDGQELNEHLASHGYVVASIDHFDASIVAYPDGRYVYISDALGRETTPELLQDRIRDLSLLLDTLSRWNEEDPFFSERLDVQRTATIGWSNGGMTASEFCRDDPRVNAAILLEAYPQIDGTVLAAGLSKPVLSIYAGNDSHLELFNRLKRDAIWFQLRFSEHWSFSSWYWTLTPPPLDRPREASRTITDYTLWFLNKHLKSSNDPMPDPKAYPQVFNFKQK